MPRFGVFSAPMLFRDEANAAATIHDPAVQKAMFDLATPKRMVGIATLDLGASDYGAKNAIMRLADFKGKKLRINGTELEREKMAKLGATGIGMPLSEVMPALDQGTIDGTISGLSVFVAFKMNDLLKVVTVTNGGVYGSLLSTPIVNPPQSGILGMHTIQERPVAVAGAVVIRPMMYVALSYDHRIVDGKEAVTFLVRVKEMIENPARILLEI